MSRLGKILPFLLLFAACGPSREVEPNDSYQQATPLKPGRTTIGTIANPKDADWYRLDVHAAGVLSARIGGIRDVDFVLSAFDKDRRELIRADETTVGGDEQLLGLGVSPGVYYLVVTNKNPAANNPTQEYRLETKLEPDAGRERQPNFTALTAQGVEAGGVVRGWYWPTRNLLADDPNAAGVDHWFSIDVQKQGLFLLNVDVSEVPKVDPVLEVYDTNAYKLASVDQGGIGEGESLRNFGVRGPAKYLLRLRSKYDNAGNPDVPFDVMTELLPYQGRTEFEPNNQRSDATPFELDSIQGTIAPAGDVDWYKISVASDSKQLLRVELTGVPGMDLTLTLKDALGNDLLLVDNAGKEQPEVLTGYGVTKGDYYVVVAEKSGKKADARSPYTLTKKLIPWQPGLEWESNDSTGTAQALKIGDSVDGYFAPRGDVDWYEFNVYQKGVVELDLTGIVNVAPTATLFDQEYKTVASAAAAKPGDPVVLTRELDRGTYEVRLQPGDASQNNVRDKYSFRILAK
ncbi:MAG: PPC domain-containing protein [Elusimicrobiota bacterium]